MTYTSFQSTTTYEDCGPTTTLTNFVRRVTEVLVGRSSTLCLSFYLINLTISHHHKPDGSTITRTSYSVRSKPSSYDPRSGAHKVEYAPFRDPYDASSRTALVKLGVLEQILILDP